MDLFTAIKTQKDGMSIRTDEYEYNLKVNSKKQIVMKARPHNQYYMSNQLDKYNIPSSKKDCIDLVQRVKSWKRCSDAHNKSHGNRWWCSQDVSSCPVCEFEKLLTDCDNADNKVEECTLCGTIMSKVYTGDNKLAAMPNCSHSICQLCMDSILDTSSTNAPELEGYKINCPFCRTQNIIPYS
jgi:hypothetical protein